MKLIQKRIFSLVVVAICVVIYSLPTPAQSTDLNFPTAVTTNEINGTIKARDIGDSRVTSYFYTFDGGQGDVFINAVTKNFNGDIDVFAAEGLRPLTKMVVYSDGGDSETGRLVYLRKPERLILRVEGRSPNDDPATFRIKFAGSFIAAAEQKLQQDPAVAKQGTDPESGIRVNSVGTIVEVIPKPAPPAKAKPEAPKSEATAANRPEKAAPKSDGSGKLPERSEDRDAKATIPKTPKRPASIPDRKEYPAGTNYPSSKSPVKPAKVAKTDAIAKTVKKDTPEVKTVLGKPSKTANETAVSEPAKVPSKPAAPPTAKVPDPMASIRLVVQLKDGDVIERTMSEVKKFSVDKGVLTVTANDGSIVRYSMLDVSKVTIQ